jgi:hypothetical protein
MSKPVKLTPEEQWLWEINDEPIYTGLIEHAAEWVKEGWRLEGDPSPEQLAAAMLMEASNHHVMYATALRKLAFLILNVLHGTVTTEQEILWKNRLLDLTRGTAE